MDKTTRTTKDVKITASDSKLITQSKLNRFATKFLDKIKARYDGTFKEARLTEDKKLIFTKTDNNTQELDLREYARLKDKNNFKQDVSADNVVILSNRQIGDPNSNTSENRSLGFRGLTNNSFVDGYVSELVILVDSDASVGSQTTWNVWAIKKGETRDRDTVKKLIQQNGSNDIRVNVQSFNDNGTTRKYVIIPINEGFTEEVYFIIRSQNTRCNVRTNIDSKYHPDVVNMSRDQPPMNQGELINWGSNSTNNTAIMYLRGRESIGSLHNKINKLNSKDGIVKSVNGKIGEVNLELEATADKLKLKIKSGSETTDIVETAVDIITDDEIDTIINNLQD